MQIVLTSRHTFSARPARARAKRPTILLGVVTAFVILGAMAASPAMAQSQPDLGKGSHIAYAPAGDSSLRQAGSTQPSGNIRLSPGFSWQESFSGPAWVFEDIAFADSQTGFAAAELGKVLKTDDGGATWSTVMNLGFPYYWYGVQALDAQRAVISGVNNQTGDGVLRWSFDGGSTWSDDILLTGNPYPIRGSLESRSSMTSEASL